jgi:hypothetical protein
VIQTAYVKEVSTRKVDVLVQALGLTGVDKSKVSRVCKELGKAVTAFRKRPLEAEYPQSLMNTLAVMCCPFAGGNPLFVVHHTDPPDGRGPGGDRPYPEQSQLNPTSTAENERCFGCCSSVRQTREWALGQACPISLIRSRTILSTSSLGKGFSGVK